MTTEFYPLKNYEGRYEISKTGLIRTIERTYVDSKGRLNTQKQSFMKINIDRSGYPVVKLTKPDGSYGTQYLHRLLAINFIPRVEGKNIVNHLDGNKRNYELNNLQWSTPKENFLHAVNNKLIKLTGKKMVAVKNRCNGEAFSTIKAASRVAEINYYKFKQMLHGLRPNKTCYEIAA